MCDDALPQRNQFSLTLQQNAPKANEFYLSGLRLYQHTYTPTQENTHRSLPGKVLHALREEGLQGFAVRTAAWLKRKTEALLRRLHL